MIVLLAGCTTGAEYREILMPVPVACTPDVGDRPDYPDSDVRLALSVSPAERYARLIAGRGMRIEREVILESALTGCAGAK